MNSAEPFEDFISLDVRVIYVIAALYDLRRCHVSHNMGCDNFLAVGLPCRHTQPLLVVPLGKKTEIIVVLFLCRDEGGFGSRGDIRAVKSRLRPKCTNYWLIFCDPPSIRRLANASAAKESNGLCHTLCHQTVHYCSRLRRERRPRNTRRFLRFSDWLHYMKEAPNGSL